MHPFLKLIRAGNVLVALLGTIVGGLDAAGLGNLGSLSLWILLLLAALSTASVTAAGNVLNDVLDVESDQTNHPDRPLVTGSVSLRAGRLTTAGLFLLGIAAGVPVATSHPTVGIILAVAVLTLLGYEFRLKASGFGGNLLIAFLTGAVFLYGAAAAGNVTVAVPFAVMAFGATLSREVIKDMEDAPGDVGRGTLPRLRGMRMAGRIARLSVAGAIVASPLPLLLFVPLGSVAGAAYLTLVLVSDAIFVVSVAWLPERLHFGQTTSKVAMAVALFAFLAAAFR